MKETGRKYLFLYCRTALLMLCLSSICSAQPATIDSVSVDESKGEILVYGNLGVWNGFVFVDSVSLPIAFWTDSVCGASIPLSGKGSAGLVVIGAKGFKSEGRMLTSLRPYVSSGQYQLQPYFPTQFDNTQLYHYHFRCDIESRILNASQTIRIFPSSDSRLYTSSSTNDEKNNSALHNDSSAIQVNYNNGDFIFYLGIYSKTIPILFHNNGAIANLNTQYQPIYFYDIMGRAHSHGDYTDLGDWGSTFPPRPEYFHLLFTPMAYPKDSNYFSNDIIKLFWTKSTSEIGYEIQAAKDSIFQSILIDTFVNNPGLDLQNISDGKYFWRVRVTDSVGNGQWSNIAQFQYSVVNKVDKQTFFNFSSYPNPLTTKTTFSFNLPIEEFTSLKIFNPLGNEVAILENKRLPAGDQHIEFDASRLPTGVYYYRLQVGQLVETKPLIVTH